MTTQLPKIQRRPVEVTVTETVTYAFPDPGAKCSAHGQELCLSCARNPGNCVDDHGGCGMWSSTGMHWDTCPNRIR